jgi:hypothetical protein
MLEDVQRILAQMKTVIAANVQEDEQRRLTYRDEDRQQIDGMQNDFIVQIKAAEDRTIDEQHRIAEENLRFMVNAIAEIMQQNSERHAILPPNAFADMIATVGSLREDIAALQVRQKIVVHSQYNPGRLVLGSVRCSFSDCVHPGSCCSG